MLYQRRSALLWKIMFSNLAITIGYKKTGTAMGTPLSVTYATLFFVIHERKFVPKYETNLALYKCYIDNVFGILIPNDDPIEDARLLSWFKADLNDFQGVEWITQERSSSVNFLDLTVTIADGKVETTLYKKLLNLYLYIPPHSAHSPGVIKRFVLGNCYRVYSSCSIKKRHKNIYKRFTTDYTSTATNLTSSFHYFIEPMSLWSDVKLWPHLPLVTLV